MVISVVRALLANGEWFASGYYPRDEHEQYRRVMASQLNAKYRPIAPRNVLLPFSSFLSIRTSVRSNIIDLFIITFLEIVFTFYVMRKVRQIQFRTFLTSIFFSFSKKFLEQLFLSNARERWNFYPI